MSKKEFTTTWTIERVLELRREPYTLANASKLRQALTAQDGHVRILAAESLARWRVYPEDTLPVLIAVLNTAQQPSVRDATYAEEWLRVSAGAIGYYGSNAVSAVPALVRVLSDKDYNVRGYAARSLGQVGPLASNAIPALEGALRQETIPEIRELLQQALANIRPKQ